MNNNPEDKKNNESYVNVSEDRDPSKNEDKDPSKNLKDENLKNNDFLPTSPIMPSSQNVSNSGEESLLNSNVVDISQNNQPIRSKQEIDENFTLSREHPSNLSQRTPELKKDKSNSRPIKNKERPEEELSIIESKIIEKLEERMKEKMKAEMLAFQEKMEDKINQEVKRCMDEYINESSKKINEMCEKMLDTADSYKNKLDPKAHQELMSATEDQNQKIKTMNELHMKKMEALKNELADAKIRLELVTREEARAKREAQTAIQERDGARREVEIVKQINATHLATINTLQNTLNTVTEERDRAIREERDRRGERDRAREENATHLETINTLTEERDRAIRKVEEIERILEQTRRKHALALKARRSKIAIFIESLSSRLYKIIYILCKLIDKVHGKFKKIESRSISVKLLLPKKQNNDAPETSRDTEANFVVNLGNRGRSATRNI